MIKHTTINYNLEQVFFSLSLMLKLLCTLECCVCRCAHALCNHKPLPFVWVWTNSISWLMIVVVFGQRFVKYLLCISILRLRSKLTATHRIQKQIVNLNYTTNTQKKRRSKQKLKTGLIEITMQTWHGNRIQLDRTACNHFTAKFSYTLISFGRR